MTIPAERTRALKWAREFLLEIRNPDMWPSVPEELRHQALVILRHFPDPSEIEHLHLLAPSLIGPAVAPKEQKER